MEWNDSTQADDQTDTTAATDKSVTRQVHNDRNGQVSMAQKKWSYS
ncbi:MAG: hypothetical protein WBQ37_10900 [Candidatus Competibacter sp.]